MKIVIFIWSVLFIASCGELKQARAATPDCFTLKSGPNIDTNLTNAVDLPLYYIVSQNETLAVTERYFFADNDIKSVLKYNYKTVNCSEAIKYKEDTAKRVEYLKVRDQFINDLKILKNL